MTDPKKLYTDNEKFMKRVRYFFKDETTIDYINVVEPQGRGAWHCHFLLRFNDLEKIFIANKKMALQIGRETPTDKDLFKGFSKYERL